MSALDLDVVKAYLNITDAFQDVELQGFINQAESSLGNRVGPLTATAVTERHEPPWGHPIVVRVLPAISLTSLTPSVGVALDATLFELDSETGILRLKGTSDRYWTWHQHSAFSGPYTVVYQAGWASLPNDLELGAMELVRHLWETQRRSIPQARVAISPGDLRPGGAFAYPYRVLELIAPYDLQAI